MSDNLDLVRSALLTIWESLPWEVQALVGIFLSISTAGIVWANVKTGWWTGKKICQGAAWASTASGLSGLCERAWAWLRSPSRAARLEAAVQSLTSQVHAQALAVHQDVNAATMRAVTVQARLNELMEQLGEKPLPPGIVRDSNGNLRQVVAHK